MQSFLRLSIRNTMFINETRKKEEKKNKQPNEIWSPATSSVVLSVWFSILICISIQFLDELICVRTIRRLQKRFNRFHFSVPPVFTILSHANYMKCARQQQCGTISLFIYHFQYVVN